MAFDFAAYLSTLYPGTEYEIQILSGGLVNNTVRARRTAGSAGRESVILKHAPPYVASVGPAMPFSQSRQGIEATALGLFNPGGSLSQLQPTSSDNSAGSVVIPDLVHHDSEAFVIILEDLGPLGTLWDLINSNCDKSGTDLDSLNGTFGDIGRRVGQFFARLHSPGIPAIIRKDSQSAAEILSHSLTEQLVYEAAVEVILERLQQYSIPNAQSLYDRVVEDYRKPRYKYPLCLSLGDFHPGSIMTESRIDEPVAANSSKRTVAIIDWEFASVQGRGANGDMAQFLAYIRCRLIALSPGSLTYEGVKAFVRNMCGAYARGMDHDFSKAETTHLLRSSLILHGREIINQAFERDWGVDQARLDEMVKVGAWYIERAGDDVEHMLAEENWEQLENKPDDMIISLFKSP